MLRNYFKIAWRSLAANKTCSVINIGGLAVGMMVAILIGLWIYDEFSYNKYHENYRRIARIMQQQTLDGEINTGNNVPAPLLKILETNFEEDFDRVVITSWLQRHVLTYGGSSFTKPGNFMSAGAAEMLSLKILNGSTSGLKDPATILLSESVAKAFFKDSDPIDKMMKLNKDLIVRVVGVYEDIPYNSEFRELAFIVPFDLFVSSTPWVKDAVENGEWESSSFQILVQVSKNSNLKSVSEKIKNTILKRTTHGELKFKPQILLHPMSQWHLYSEWSNGSNIGGRIQFVWLFGIIGLFVLLLACINFMNLSTARSQKRAKEVGIRKAIGSVRLQLVVQFFSESFLVVFFAFFFSLVLAWLAMPIFNEIADKQMLIPWGDPNFLMSGIMFTILTGLIAGSYPAFYLSSFQPIKALKGKWSPLGLHATLPRKILVVLQFTVSISLIIGTVVVYRQILHAKDRPIGYNRKGLVTMLANTQEIHRHFDAMRDDLLKTGSVISVAESVAPPTEVFSANVGFNWKGKDPSLNSEFATVGISHDFGKTVGWQFVAGRDFARNFSTDSAGFVVNEAAVKFMGLGNRDVVDAIGETVTWDGRQFKIIGVIKDMIMESPYDPVKKSIFFIHPKGGRFITARLNPGANAGSAIKNIEAVFKKYSPDLPFNYQFVDDEYALKFASEERINKLAAVFAGLAILISCLGLFGMASFITEQRTKEIGVRKVLGASITSLWQLLLGDFVILIVVSCLLATPIAWYAMDQWLEKYAYHTQISWWIFAFASLGTLAITFITVSYQVIQTALLDPVKSLRSE
ncbi:ABC-type antimicrobial peptide transport system, permease component [Dyadobacter koreensis]|uniref:ABC-type antimicrobial peptide transport system, permease component n=1 Tax=Dyadobacter koreensis TaxID=408657 RepID=A0A1H6YG44_9BACT|nr:ABC transporter permease [Dyadobacter koreensis]SEJ37977.1 ABC-type antimicrobial peptide transport system, permease component [Dyadobacter koreensis]